MRTSKRHPGLFKAVRSTKAKDGRTVRKASPYWSCRFTHPVTGKRVTVPLRTENAEDANELFQEAKRQARLESRGLANPFADQQQKPIALHLDEWGRSITAAGNSASYARLAKRRAKRIIDGCGIEFWKDIQASAVEAFIAELRDDRAGYIHNRAGAQTRNYHRQSVRQFCRWMYRDGRAPLSALEHMAMDRKSARKDQRHARRALLPDELRATIDTAENGPRSYGVAGPDRAKLYTFAASTGLRAAEIRSLVWRSFDLDAATPTVTVSASYAKNSREDTLPLTPAVAQMLRTWRSQRPGDGDDTPVFRMPSKSNVARMMRRDLEAADIEYRDADGRVADFHSLRHFFGTSLALAGVAPKVVMDLMRHSDISLTMGLYSHTVLSDRTTAIQAVPDLIGTQQDTKRRAG